MIEENVPAENFENRKTTAFEGLRVTKWNFRVFFHIIQISLTSLIKTTKSRIPYKTNLQTLVGRSHWQTDTPRTQKAQRKFETYLFMRLSQEALVNMIGNDSPDIP